MLNEIQTPRKVEPILPDQVIALRDGFYARVNGKLYGPWAMRVYALAGLAVEVRRQEKRGSK